MNGIAAGEIIYQGIRLDALEIMSKECLNIRSVCLWIALGSLFKHRASHHCKSSTFRKLYKSFLGNYTINPWAHNVHIWCNRWDTCQPLMQEPMIVCFSTITHLSNANISKKFLKFQSRLFPIWPLCSSQYDAACLATGGFDTTLSVYSTDS